MKAHFLPASYLKGFLDPASEAGPGEPYLWVRDPATRSWKKRAPHNLAKKTDYYVVTRADGRKDDAREQALAQLESIVAPILRRIPRADTLTLDDAAALVLFASTAYLRLPVVHDGAEQAILLPLLRKTVAERWEMLRSDHEELRRSLEACARDTSDPRVLSLQPEDFDLNRYELLPNREFLVASLFSVGPQLVKILSLMRWRLLRVSEPQVLITSDRPVSVVDPKAHSSARHSLLSPGAMFTLPLTKEVLLLGDWGGLPGMTWARITAAGVRDMNLRCAGPGLRLYSPTPEFLGHSELLAMEDDSKRANGSQV